MTTEPWPAGLTPSQTVGPFFGLQRHRRGGVVEQGGLPWPQGPYAVADGTPGAIWIRGRVLDGDGDPVPDALVETWQAAPGHRAFARCPTDGAGRYAVCTVKPEPVPGPDGTHPGAAPGHVRLRPRPARPGGHPGLLRRRGGGQRGRPGARAGRRRPALDRSSPRRRDDGYRFDIRLQGEGETVFFDDLSPRRPASSTASSPGAGCATPSPTGPGCGPCWRSRPPSPGRRPGPD